MPDLPEFLKRDAVLFMRDQALKEYGGTRGLKSQNLLQSALARAENRWYYDEAPRPDAAIMALRVIVPSVASTSGQLGAAASFSFDCMELVCRSASRIPSKSW
ncbi:hypothetical protein [Gluconobacter cerinus]|uniref:hypothetical protein n=1 Tax=Gluconobacter cerinus TaxID=38307 RepID=UPI00201148F9|nr:hypothetical protein [Gluconobacter cerinus]